MVKNPTRGVRRSRLPPVRKLVRSSTLETPSFGPAWTISTICHNWSSSELSGELAAGNAGGWQVWFLPVASGTLNDCGVPCITM